MRVSRHLAERDMMLRVKFLREIQPIPDRGEPARIAQSVAGNPRRPVWFHLALVSRIIANGETMMTTHRPISMRTGGMLNATRRSRPPQRLKLQNASSEIIPKYRSNMPPGNGGIGSR